MATLCIADDSVEDFRGENRAARPRLREWLAGDWGLLFSHPDDFDRGGLEADRWLAILREAFRQHGVRPLGCDRSASQPDTSWVGRLIGDQRVVELGGDANRSPEVIDLPLRTLREDLIGMSGRFALIVDDTLRRRGVLQYSAAHTTISPLDLLASIDALRRRCALRQAA